MEYFGFCGILMNVVKYDCVLLFVKKIYCSKFVGFFIRRICLMINSLKELMIMKFIGR